MSFAQSQSQSLTWQVPVTTTRSALLPAWVASTAYVLGQAVTNGGSVFRCSAAGTSAGSGGPTGVATAITDGGVTWRFLQASPSFKGGTLVRCLSTSASPMFIGDATLTATNGHEIPAGQCEVEQTANMSTVYLVTASGTATATVRAYQ